MNLRSERPQASRNWSGFLQYQLISHNNYFRTAINELTTENLQKLAVFAETIDDPFILGKFNNEQHYLQTLNLVLNSTHETRNRKLFFLNEIIPIIPMGGSLLDIGPGDGSLTTSIAQNFKHITLVDINHHALTNLKKLLSPSISTLLIPKNILDSQLKTDDYHLAILSHMLYYIEPKYWFKIIKSVYTKLKENGVIVIIMGDDLDKSELMENFGGKNLNIDQLATECCNIFGTTNVNLYASNEAFITCSLNAMLHISAFMLADANVSASKDALTTYIRQKFQYSENHFEMTTRQKYIVIVKDNQFKDKLYVSEREPPLPQSKN